MRYVKYGLGILAFALLVFLSWLTLTPAPQGLLVLEYHHICDEIGEDGVSYAVPVKDFAQQLDYLRSQGYTTITMQTFLSISVVFIAVTCAVAFVPENSTP